VRVSFLLLRVVVLCCGFVSGNCNVSSTSGKRQHSKIAQMVAPIKTTASGGLHGLLALVLDDTEYALITKT
jgi:hypothetical protein